MRSSEKGAVLGVLAVIVVTLILLISVAIEWNLLSVASEQAQDFGRTASLAAIEEYFADIDNEDVCPQESVLERHACAMDRAVTRVNVVSQQNFLLGNAEASDAEVSLDGGSGARLVAGRWRADEIDGVEVCPNNAPPPCFVECEEHLGADDSTSYPCTDFDSDTLEEIGVLPNAFRIEGKFFEEGVVLHLASRMLGSDRLVPHVAATSTFVPRRGCFLVDISPSVAYDTHLRWSDGGPYCALPGDQLTCGEAPGPALSDGFGNHYAFVTKADNTFIQNDYPFMDRGWQYLFEDPSGAGTAARNGAPYIATKHYFDDYARKYVLSDADYDAITGPGHDSRWDKVVVRHPRPDDEGASGGTYTAGEDSLYAQVDGYPGQGPEPLSSVMQGLNEALQQFKNRHISGDQACLIFFDRSLPWTRVVNLTDDFDYLIQFTDFENPSALTVDSVDRGIAQHDLVTNGPGDTGRERSTHFGLFPFRATYTDIRLALEEGMGQLDKARESGITASEFLVLFTDGLQNCSSGPEGTICANTLGRYQEGMDALIEWFASPDEGWDERRVPIHVILNGAHVGPHTVDLPKEHDDAGLLLPPGQTEDCLLDEEYRKLPVQPEFDFVKGIEKPDEGDWNSMGPDAPFYTAGADWFKIAVVSQGLWGPLRERDDAVCDSGILPDDSPETPLRVKYLDSTVYRPFCQSQLLPPGGPEDRRVNDPYCRPKVQQIRDYLKRIIGQNPFTVVQVK